MKRASLYSPEHAALVELLRDLRLENGLSQTEAANALDRPQTYVSAVEVGQRGIDLLQVREMCLLYGTTLPKFVIEFEERIKGRPYRPPRRPRVDASPRASTTDRKKEAKTGAKSKPKRGVK